MSIQYSDRLETKVDDFSGLTYLNVKKTDPNAGLTIVTLEGGNTWTGTYELTYFSNGNEPGYQLGDLMEGGSIYGGTPWSYYGLVLETGTFNQQGILFTSQFGANNLFVMQPNFTDPSQNALLDGQLNLLLNSTTLGPNVVHSSLTSVGTLVGLNVSGNITANTISATNWVGLPPSPLPSLAPITLDTVNNRVGINNATPTAALDVSGNITQSTGTASLGGLTVPSISCSGNISGTLTTAAQPNITSVGTLSTLNVTGDVVVDTNTFKVDSTNNRVGINNAFPQQALDVVGNITATGMVSINPSALGTKLYCFDNGAEKYGLGVSSLAGSGELNYFSPVYHRFYYGGDNNTGAVRLTINGFNGNVTQHLGVFSTPSISCSGNISGTLTTAAQPNITSVGTLSTLNVTGDVVVDTNTLKVDSTNNRVGICTTTPAYTLDVNGDTSISGNINQSTANNATLGTLYPGTINHRATNSDALNLFQTFANNNSLILQGRSQVGAATGIGIRFFTSAAGSNTATEAFRLDSSQNASFYGNITQTAGKTASLGALTVPSITCSGNISGTLTTAAQGNITSVGTLSGLTVGGAISQTSGTSSLGALTVPSINCSGTISGTLTTAAQPNITSVGTLSTLNVTGDVVVDTNTLKVDSTNNRVGINTTNPAYDLDVNGSCNISGGLTVGGTIVNAGIGSTTVYKNSSILYSPASSGNAWQSFFTLTIPANSLCMVDAVVIVTKNSSSTSGEYATIRLQSTNAAGVVVYNRQNQFLTSSDSAFTGGTGIGWVADAINTQHSAELVFGDCQPNPTSSPITLYIGWYLYGGTPPTAANMYRINAGEATAYVTKIATI